MNNKRRELLKNATGLLDQASGMVQMALDSEQDCLDNMPENLLDSERCQKMEDAIESLSVNGHVKQLKLPGLISLI